MIRSFVQLSFVRWCNISLPIHSSPSGSPNPLAYSSHDRLKSTEPSSRFWMIVQGPIHFAITGRRWFNGAIMCKPLLSDEFISEQSLGSALTMFSYCISTLSSSSKSCAVECTLSDVELDSRVEASLFPFDSNYEWNMRKRRKKIKLNYNYDMTGFSSCLLYIFIYFPSHFLLCLFVAEALEEHENRSWLIEKMIYLFLSLVFPSLFSLDSSIKNFHRNELCSLEVHFFIIISLDYYGFCSWIENIAMIIQFIIW